MGIVRKIVQDQGGLTRGAAGGDLAVEVALPLRITADANRTLTVADIARGVLSFDGFTAARTLTTDSAANILAAFPTLAVGEAVALEIGISVAFAGNITAGAGVTRTGKAAVPAPGFATMYFIKTSSTTMECLVV